MFVKGLILVGLLTSLLVTMVLYVTIGHHIPTGMGGSPALLRSKSQFLLRGTGAIDVSTKDAPFRCQDGSNKRAIENDDYCDCTTHIINILQYITHFFFRY